MTDIESTAIEAVAAVVAPARNRAAMASIIMAVSGNLFARLMGHDAAFRRHTELARQHLERTGRLP